VQAKAIPLVSVERKSRVAIAAAEKARPAVQAGMAVEVATVARGHDEGLGSFAHLRVSGGRRKLALPYAAVKRPPLVSAEDTGPYAAAAAVVCMA